MAVEAGARVLTSIERAFMGAPARSAADHYTGRETAIPERLVKEAADPGYFQVTRGRIPAGGIPILDGDQRIIIGYRTISGGVTRVFDLDGRQVSIEEPGLEAPLLDPTDLIFIVGSIGRIAVRSLLRTGAEVAADVGGKVAVRVVSDFALLAMRQTLRRLVQRELKFTATTVARMENPARFVPINILKLAIRYGVRRPDSQGVAGAFKYTVPMFRAAKVAGQPAKQYTLHVVVREADWTVLHFHYE